MAFDQTTITEVYPPRPSGSGIRLSWASSSAEGTIFQVYVNLALAWSGPARDVTIQARIGDRIDIGTVGAGEGSDDFSSSLTSGPDTRANLTWLGGLYLDADLAGFRVYGETTAGGGVNYTTPLTDIQAYPEGFISDGFGMGGFGQGGFGTAAASFSWTSEPLTSGTWTFAVIPYDTTGNEGTPMTDTVSITAPPGPPARFSSDGLRLHYTYSATTYKITLAWNPSE